MPTTAKHERQLAAPATRRGGSTAPQAGSRALGLEILGDLPDADIKPPEDTIFVAQLNPSAAALNGGLALRSK